MLHKGCRRVARAGLADIPVPEASGRHMPVPHHVLADTVVATAEAARYARSPRALGRARLGTLRRLLTLHARKERFCEGHLAAVFESGHLAAILRRLRAIRARMG